MKYHILHLLIQPQVIRPQLIQHQVIQPHFIQPHFIQPQVIQHQVIQHQVIQQSHNFSFNSTLDCQILLCFHFKWFMSRFLLYNQHLTIQL